METLVAVFGVTLALFGVAVGAMVIGTKATGKCLRGSCGGPAVIGPDGKEIEGCATCPNRDRKH